MLRIPFATQRNILDGLTFIEAQMTRYTCTLLATHENSFEPHLNRFLVEHKITYDFRGMLREFGAALSGSTIWQIMHNVRYAKSDLDIYFPLNSIFTQYHDQIAKEIINYIDGGDAKRLTDTEKITQIIADMSAARISSMLYQGQGSYLNEADVLACQEWVNAQIVEKNEAAKKIHAILGGWHVKRGETDYNLIFVRYPNRHNYIRNAIESFDFDWLKNRYDGSNLRVLNWNASLVMHSTLTMNEYINDKCVMSTLSRVYKYGKRGFVISASPEYLRYAHALIVRIDCAQPVQCYSREAEAIVGWCDKCVKHMHWLNMRDVLMGLLRIRPAGLP